MRRCLPSRTLGYLVAAALFARLSVADPAEAASGYVFSTFHNDTPAGEKLSTYRSPDALNFTLVADTGFAGPTGYLRDPSIMKHIDGKYYVAYTDPPGVGCCGKQDHFSIASTADLVHLTNLTTVLAGVPGVAHTWAPEWFVDGSTVSVIANIDTLNNDTDFKPYVFTAKDSTLTTWSGPVPLGIGPNFIDSFVLKVHGVYHVFAKNETTRYLEHATAASLTGPWTFVGTGDWSGFGAGMEGPCIVQLDDGTWRIFVDAQYRPVTARFLTATSPDLTTWSAPVVLPSLGSLRHGTVTRDTPAGPTFGDGGMGADAGMGADGGSGMGSGSGVGGDDGGRNEAAAAGDASDDATLASTRPDASANAATENSEEGASASPDATLESGPSPFVDSGADGRPAHPRAGGCSCRTSGAHGERSGRPAGSALFFPFAVLFALKRLRGRRRKSERSAD